MGAGFRLSGEGQKVVDALQDVLDAGIALFDAQEHAQHLAMSSCWFSGPSAGPSSGAKGCHLHLPINNRWTLMVFKRRLLHPDAEAIATWAAAKLRAYLVDFEIDPAYPPARGGGGTSGSAEIGIPLWWALKARR